MTVLFSDVRGFTTFSEAREPEVVIDVLNRYLTMMTDVILGHGGTLVTFMGDGIMAVFGAPIETEDHADRALAAAREMAGPALDSFNEWMAERGETERFRIGIGLNSGAVMAGNVGSERRLEYTVIGDTTNTASRLEGMTKGTPHTIFLADSTREMLTREDGDLEHVDSVDIRGRSAQVVIWTTATRRTDASWSDRADSLAASERRRRAHDTSRAGRSATSTPWARSACCWSPPTASRPTTWSIPRRFRTRARCSRA